MKLKICIYFYTFLYLDLVNTETCNKGQDQSNEPSLESSLQLIKQLRNATVNRYILYTTRNPSAGQFLEIGNQNSIRNSNFNPYCLTVVVVHGWLQNYLSDINPTIKKALLEVDDVNVIVVDWSLLSMSGYITAATAVPQLGRALGEFVQYLQGVTGISWDSIHLVGFSLGAHFVGNAGRHLDGKIARITGLDPAGPLWSNNPSALNKNDAVYVEAIHTNGAALGTRDLLGDTDFYPNGGNSQPGCFTPACSHNRAWMLFASSMTHQRFVGSQCSTTYQLALNMCNGKQLPMGNNDLHKTGSGIYRLQTGSQWPY